MNIKKYVDIERLKENYASNFIEGENIVIEEKIDFSNASFRYDSITNSIIAFSRRQELNENNTLNGFWDWVKKLPINRIKEIIGTRYIIFGEWAGSPHSIKYPDDIRKKFWMFDVWDTEIEQYLPLEDTLEIFNKLSPYLDKFVPIFYNGPFISWEHVMSFVGKSDIGASPCGEGIVIKRQDNLDSKSSKNPYYVKIVSERFSEVHKSKSKIVNPEKIAQREIEMENVATIVTKRRIEKGLEKIIEDNFIPYDWNEYSMKAIAKILPSLIYEDCKKEEPDVVIANENFGKICSQLTMKYVREILNNKSKFI